MDGWGRGKMDNSDGTFLAKTPFIDSLYHSAPLCYLKTFGENVGLPDGQMGNSEVGHLNIGAGRVIYQMLVRINKAFQNNEVKTTNNFQKMVNYLHGNPLANIHLTGLISDGGVHSSLDHAIALCQLFTQQELDHRVYLHIITDGRDTDPKNGIQYVQDIINNPAIGRTKIATVIGRYYAMDRDKRWERTALFHQLLTKGEGKSYNNVLEGIEDSYRQNITDEFINPIKFPDFAPIKEGDVFFMFNYRTDRGRQIIQALSQEDYNDYGMQKLAIQMYTMTEYDKKYQNVNVLFDQTDLKNTLGEILSMNGKKQLRAAETEKYPHVTFFFNGGREEPFENEDRILVNSPKVATYDLQPEMSAIELTEKILQEIKTNTYDFMVINFANPDMVGHTGVKKAIIKACETIDQCVEKIYDEGIKNDYQFIITADHGNADLMYNDDGSPHTAHTTNLVPCFVISPAVKQLNDGKLADLAPTILDLLQIKRPIEMKEGGLL